MENVYLKVTIYFLEHDSNCYDNYNGWLKSQRLIQAYAGPRAVLLTINKAGFQFLKGLYLSVMRNSSTR